MQGFAAFVNVVLRIFWVLFALFLPWFLKKCWNLGASISAAREAKRNERDNNRNGPA
jgi:hypothetical protein